MTTQAEHLQAIQELRSRIVKADQERRLNLSVLLYPTAIDKSHDQSSYRAKVNDHIFAAMALIEVASRESDLFRCNGCGEHFKSQELNPRCESNAHSSKPGESGFWKSRRDVENVPEDTPYCGTCNLGLEDGEHLDESGCCNACAKAFREAYPHGVRGSLPWGA
jgi:hypothetical protein